MQNESKLGTIPYGGEGRDAVHVAIVPVRAAQLLRCGDAVKLNAAGKAVPCEVYEAIGAVDPFLPEYCRELHEDEWFWLCLFPKTITGLRHVWEHPSFPESLPQVGRSPEPGLDKIASRTWLEEYVRRHCPYWSERPHGGRDEFIRMVKEEKYIYYAGSNCHSLSEVEDADELFRHLSVLLDMRITASYFEAFTCSC